MQTTLECIQRSHQDSVQLSTDSGRELVLFLSHTAPASSHVGQDPRKPIQAVNHPETAKFKLFIPAASKQNHPTTGQGTPQAGAKDANRTAFPSASEHPELLKSSTLPKEKLNQPHGSSFLEGGRHHSLTNPQVWFCHPSSSGPWISALALADATSCPTGSISFLLSYKLSQPTAQLREHPSMQKQQESRAIPF